MDTKVPKYEVVKKGLLDYIDNMPETQEYLPYESELEKMFNVSKRTIRRALLDLRKAGLIDTGRKRGSKVIRQTTINIQQSQPTLEKFLNGANIASVFTSDKPGHERTGFIPWRITGELEVKAAQAGGGLVVYNLRDERWQNIDNIIESLKQNNIEWFFCYYHSDLDERVPFSELIKNKIKPVVYLQDFNLLKSFAYKLTPGVDWIATNNLNGIYDYLCQHFADADYLAYIGGESDIDWEQSRIEAIQHFTDQFNIKMEIILSNFSNSTSNNRDVKYTTDQARRTHNAKEATEKLLKTIKQSRRPLLIGANDIYANGVVQCLDEHKITYPDQVEVLGYDNSTLAMQDNLSSFYQDYEKVADLAFNLCRNFYTDKESMLQQSHARSLPSSLFKRLSTK